MRVAESYEVQILNNGPGQTIPDNEAGAFYRFRAPDVNASRGAGVWQSYFIRYTAPRWSGSTKTASARISVYWNGALIHDDLEVTRPTGSGVTESPGPKSLRLQAKEHDAMGDVCFRNIWLAPIPITPDDYRDWTEKHDLRGVASLPDSDSDGDSVAQIWEFGANGDPETGSLTSFDEPLLPVFGKADNFPAERKLTMTYRRRTDFAALGLQYGLLEADTPLPSEMTPYPFAEIGSPVPSGDGVTEFQTLEFEAPPEARAFFRVTLDFAP